MATTIPTKVVNYTNDVAANVASRVTSVLQSNTTAGVGTPVSIPANSPNDVVLQSIDRFQSSLNATLLTQTQIQANVALLAATTAATYAPLDSPSFTGNIKLLGPITANSTVGTSGQYLASSGNGAPYWATFAVAGTPALDAVLAVGSTSSRTLGVGNTTISGTAAITGTASIAGHTMIGPIAGSSSSGNQTSLELRNNGGTGDSDVAAVSFHCAGSFGVHQHLRADGYFGVGGWSASAWRWYVNTTNGDMTAAGNVTAYSDPRLKEDITPIESALAKVLRWKGVKYRWKQGSVIGHPGQYDYGVLSSDIQPDAPELVVDSVWDSGEGDKYKTVAYSKMTPFLIEALREQQTQIDELRAQVASLIQSKQ
jgi:Chaperone of endosialidase